MFPKIIKNKISSICNNVDLLIFTICAICEKPHCYGNHVAMETGVNTSRGHWSSRGQRSRLVNASGMVEISETVVSFWRTDSPCSSYFKIFLTLTVDLEGVHRLCWSQSLIPIFAWPIDWRKHTRKSNGSKVIVHPDDRRGDFIICLKVVNNTLAS